VCEEGLGLHVAWSYRLREQRWIPKTQQGRTLDRLRRYFHAVFTHRALASKATQAYEDSLQSTLAQG
jgi:hypothetical protein